MYWIIILLVLVYFMCMCSTRENFQEIFGFSGMKKSVDDTSFQFGSGGEYPDYTDVTDDDGITHDEVNMCVKETMNMLNNKLSVCSYPVETSKIRKLVKDSDVIFTCKFMFMVTSTSYPFMLGMESDIKNGKVIRASTQDMYKGTAPPVREENFKDFSEVENLKVYSR